MRVVYAREPELAEKLFRFRYEMYVLYLKVLNWEDYPDGLVYDTFDNHSHNYVALDDQGAIIGSIRLTLDSHGLPIEKSYSLNEFREGRILAEMCRLVVRPQYQGGFLGALLMKSGYQCAVRDGTTHIVLETSPGISSLYLKMGFMQLGNEYYNPIYKSHFSPSIAMVLNCITAQKEWPYTHPRLYRFFTTPDNRIEHPE